jgi:uncharacterized protein (TIGR03086 family)
MGEVKSWLRRAADRFGENLRAIGEDQWDEPTPNAEWDVRQLCAHVVDEQVWAPPLLAGQTVDEAAADIPSDPLGDDPKAAWAAAADKGLAAAEAVDLDQTVHLSFGDFPAEEYLMQLFADHLIHSWDLARATGQDERLDPDLVQACAAWFEDMEEAYRGAEAIGPPVEVDSDDPQDQLLARFGRDPRR